MLCTVRSCLRPSCELSVGHVYSNTQGMLADRNGTYIVPKPDQDEKFDSGVDLSVRCLQNPAADGTSTDGTDIFCEWKEVLDNAMLNANWVVIWKLRGKQRGVRLSLCV